MNLGQLRQLTKDLPDTATVFYEVDLGKDDKLGLCYECVDIAVQREGNSTELIIR